MRIDLQDRKGYRGGDRSPHHEFSGEGIPVISGVLGRFPGVNPLEVARLLIKQPGFRSKSRQTNEKWDG
jgi:hypothetical protein